MEETGEGMGGGRGIKWYHSPVCMRLTGSEASVPGKWYIGVLEIVFLYEKDRVCKGKYGVLELNE